MDDIQLLKELAGDGALIGAVISVIVSTIWGITRYSKDGADWLVVNLCFLGTLEWSILSGSANLALWITNSAAAVAASKLVWLLLTKHARNWLANRNSIAPDPLDQPTTSHDVP